MRTHLAIRCILLAVIAALGLLHAAPPADSPEGCWITKDNEAIVEIRVIDGHLVGRIIALSEPLFAPDDPDAGKAKFDRENPDTKRRSQPIVGLQILDGFTQRKNGKWEGGTVYDPDEGSTYSGNLRVTEEGTLELRGFWGVALLGRTEIWRRSEARDGPPPVVPAP